MQLQTTGERIQKEKKSQQQQMIHFLQTPDGHTSSFQPGLDGGTMQSYNKYIMERQSVQLQPGRT